jgi:hypothetical protein
MGELALQIIVIASVIALIAFLLLMASDLRGDDYASMDRRLARRAERRAARTERRADRRGPTH